MSKCVVPNCKSTVGVPFPKDSKIKEKWRQGLQLTNAAIKQNSIVCFSHFHPTDLRDDNSTGRRPINRLKRGAVPHINPNDNGDTDDRIELIQLNEDSEKDDKNDGNLFLVGLLCSNVLFIEEAKDEKTCRGCLTHKNVESHLFDFFEKRITISAAFTVCIPSISIARDDDLPKYFCNTCLNALKTIYKFRKKWITTDFTLRMNRKRRRSLITKSEEEEIMKKKCLKIDPNSEKQPALVISASDDFEVIYEDSICQEADDYQDSTQLEEKLLLQGTSEEKSLDMDDIEKNMEEIHGNNLSKNFVSEPTSDLSSNAEDDSVLENEQGATVEDILSTLEGGVIGERQEQGVQVSKKIVTKSKFPLVNTTKKDILPMYIKLPKGTKIKPLEYYSKVGQYSSKIRYGVYESVFIEADEYLFEIGLAKCTVRHLRCALPTCASQGKQLVNDNGDISTIVHVTTPHNHPAPNEAAKKKQMFLCLMRKKMQTDRTLNIRHIYEDACIQDPEIREVVPLRNVINEICRHQLMHKLKPVNSFEDFFSSIESDSYEKLHFTHCYIKCMENQLWIWGFYRYDGDTDDILINATHFSIVSPNDEVTEDVSEETQEEYLDYMETQENTIVMEAVIDQDGVLQTSQEIPEDEDMTENKDTQQFESEFLKYVYQ
ncbi:hypothetical protein FQA39_LY01360 [Lamprigera yunnana]|nr:hypothetical protein FQA39_LY01360 [Lamprigera yunnana]